MTISINDNQHKCDTQLNNALPLCSVSLCRVSHFVYCYAECCYAECHYDERRYAECHYAECRCADVPLGIITYYITRLESEANSNNFSAKTNLFKTREVTLKNVSAFKTRLTFTLALIAVEK